MGINGIIVGAAKCTGYLYIIGVGLIIKQAINDGHILVIGIHFHIGAA
jgi:hypothetical protein